MRERCLQSLAILLAGLFSAEGFRAQASPPGPLAPGAGPAQEKDVTAREKPDPH